MPSNLANRIEAIIANADSAFVDGVNGTQSELYRQFITLFKGLELDDDGYILANQANRAILRETSQIFNKAIRDSGYKDTVQEGVNSLNEIDSANEAYFNTISESFKPNVAFIASLQRETITNLETLLFNSGLESQIKQPLLNIINQNVNSGGSYAGFLEQLRENIVGMENEGKLLRYSRQILNDALFNYSRAYQQSITADLGLEFYYYSGGLSKDSREFCAENADQYFHQLEVEAWADEDWQGKRPDTTESSIFIYAGGYNCRHSIVPVDISTVPLDVIQRNIDSGNYVP